MAATALARGGPEAAIVALITGLTESGLRVLTNPNDPAGDLYPNQGVGYVFQQRPSWGTAAQRMDPVVSTNLFLDRLFALPEWRSLAPWRAAQAVQVSAFADGANYRRNVVRAAGLPRDISPSTATADCGGAGVGRLPMGPAGPTACRSAIDFLQLRRARPPPRPPGMSWARLSVAKPDEPVAVPWRFAQGQTWSNRWQRVGYRAVS